MIVLVSAIVELKLKYKINRHIGAMSESIPWPSHGLAISRLNYILSIKGFACVAGSVFAVNSCWLQFGSPSPQGEGVSRADAGVRGQMYRPPSTSSTTPVKKFASSLAQKERPLTDVLRR